MSPYPRPYDAAHCTCCNIGHWNKPESHRSIPSCMRRAHHKTPCCRQSRCYAIVHEAKVQSFVVCSTSNSFTITPQNLSECHKKWQRKNDRLLVRGSTLHS